MIHFNYNESLSYSLQQDLEIEMVNLVYFEIRFRKN